MKGWIKVWRKIRDSEIWIKHPLYMRVWETILIYADENGQWKTTLNRIAEEVSWVDKNQHWHKPARKDILKILEWLVVNLQVTKEIGSRGSTKHTMLTVVNWGIYQSRKPVGVMQKEPQLETQTELHDIRSTNRIIKTEEKLIAAAPKKRAAKKSVDPTTNPKTFISRISKSGYITPAYTRDVALAKKLLQSLKAKHEDPQEELWLLWQNFLGTKLTDGFGHDLRSFTHQFNYLLEHRNGKAKSNQCPCGGMFKSIYSPSIGNIKTCNKCHKRFENEKAIHRNNSNR